MPALRHDMPAQELRLHLGEMTAQEERTARAAIRWANIERDREVDSLRREVEALEEVYLAAVDVVYHAKRMIRDDGIYLTGLERLDDEMKSYEDKYQSRAERHLSESAGGDGDG